MKMKTVKASTAKPNGNPTPGDEPFGIEPAVRFYFNKSVIRLRKYKKQKSLSFAIKS